MSETTFLQVPGDNAATNSLYQILLSIGVEGVEAFKIAIPGWFLVTIPVDSDHAAVCDALIAHPFVKTAEVNHRYKFQGHNFEIDPVNQWALAPDQLNVEGAWGYGTGEDVVVAVIDTGVDYTHVDLSSNIWLNPGEFPAGVDADADGVVTLDEAVNFDPALYPVTDAGGNQNGRLDPGDLLTSLFADGVDNDWSGVADDFFGYRVDTYSNDPMDSDVSGHGTHVAGIIAASGFNVTGVAPHARIMPINAYQPTAGSLGEAINYAIYGTQKKADIINLSVTCAGGTSCDSPFLRELIDTAYLENIVVVVSAGNELEGSDGSIIDDSSTVGRSTLITVSASMNTNGRYQVANYGPALDLLAPGVEIYSTTPGGGYQSATGTSMSAAHVSGVAALMLSADPTMIHEQVHMNLRNSAEDTTGSGASDSQGYGRLNAYRAINRDAWSGFVKLDDLPRGDNGLIDLDAGDILTITGKVTLPDPASLVSYELFYKKVTYPIAQYDAALGQARIFWEPIPCTVGSCDSPVFNGILGTWDTGTISGGLQTGSYLLRLVAHSADGWDYEDIIQFHISVCGNGVIEGDEKCDGATLDGVTCESLGFDEGTLGCYPVGDPLSCTFDTSGCVSKVCGDGVCDAGEDVTSCPGDCATCGDGICSVGEDSATCPNDCSVCGNGVVEGAEACDDGDTTHFGSCNADCSALNICGDGIKNRGVAEQCDGADLGGATCAGLGHLDGGALGCKSNCTFDISQCTSPMCEGGDIDNGYSGYSVLMCPYGSTTWGGAFWIVAWKTWHCLPEVVDNMNFYNYGSIASDVWSCGKNTSPANQDCRTRPDSTNQSLHGPLATTYILGNGGNGYYNQDFIMYSCQCGNQIVDAGEVCDDGRFNGLPLKCNSSCTGITEPVCGNSIVEAGEVCEASDIQACTTVDGYAGIQSCSLDCAQYDAICQPTESCGDGIIQSSAGESCDDPANPLCVACELVECVDDSTCDDGNICNGSETCVANSCQAGTPLTCDNGLFCDGAETCDAALGCQAGTSPCDPSLESCDESANVCELICGNGTLDAGEQCDDGNILSGDGCNSNCQAENRPPVAVIEFVSESDGAVTLTAANSYDPDGDALGYPVFGDANIIYLWDFAEGTVPGPLYNFYHTPSITFTTVGDKTITVTVYDEHGAAGTTTYVHTVTQICGDGMLTGTEACDGNAMGCTDANGYAGIQNCNASCTGFNACVATEYCGDGIVQSAAGEACDNPSDPLCVSCQPVECADNSHCDDGNVCNGAETCLSNVCQTGTPLTCDNGLFCDGAETCDPATGCQAGTAPVIDDGIACTADSCDEVNDTVVHSPVDSLCDNGQFCDGEETCDAVLGCQSGTPVVCDPLKEVCDETVDQCVTYCGNAYCDADEDMTTCPQDCGVCGDGICSPETLEDRTNCEIDCSTCGDGICDALVEDVTSCPEDCDTSICGDGNLDEGEQCDAGLAGSTACRTDCTLTFCGDQFVQSPNGVGEAEVCDDGALNGQVGYCDEFCTGPTPAPTCGSNDGHDPNKHVYGIEAEDFFFNDAPFDRFNDPSASGGQYGFAPDTSGVDVGRARYNVPVDRTAEHYLWVRVIAPTVDDNEMVLHFQGAKGNNYKWEAGLTSVWQWQRVDIEPFPLKIKRGDWTLEVRIEEEGMLIDKFILTDDPVFMPGETDCLCGNDICEAGESVSNCAVDCAVCGDGIIGDGEECDDGNIVDGDGCSAVCEVEVASCPRSCDVTGPDGVDYYDYKLISDTYMTYMNGPDYPNPYTVGPGDPNEYLDVDCNGEINESDVYFCLNICWGYECVPSTCGNGIVESPETCDDGNLVNGDGCTSVCTVESDVCGDNICGPTENDVNCSEDCALH